MGSVKALCNRGVLLENGSIKELGNIDNIVNSYLKGETGISNFKNSKINIPEIELYEIGIKAKEKNYEDVITINDDIEFSLKYSQKISTFEIYPVIVLKDEVGNSIFSNGPWENYNNSQSGKFDVSVTFPKNFFNWGSIYIDLYFIENRKKAIIKETDIISFIIVNDKKEVGEWMGREPGPIHPKFIWTKNEVSHV
jgi:lipopolysaccharide transport system ATP-binding protein